MKQRLIMIILALTLILTLTGCSSPIGANQEEEGTLAATDEDIAIDTSLEITYRVDPLIVYSHDELVQAKVEAEKEEEDPNNIKGLDYYYVSSYAEAWCEFSYIGIREGYAATFYDFEESEQPDCEFNDFVVEFSRESKEIGAEYMLSNDIEMFDLQPSKTEGVFYNYIDNSIFEIKNFVQFHWVYDDYLFFMSISEELFDLIEENDPEALSGSLFEVEKIVLEA